MSDACPTCGQPWPSRGKRLCSLCRRPIGRTEKWRFGPDSRPEHRNCREVVEAEPTQSISQPRMALFTEGR